MKTDLLETRENQTLNIGLKLFLWTKYTQVIYFSYIFDCQWLGPVPRWYGWKRETRERERDSERERNKNWKTSRWIHSTYHKIDQIFTHLKFFMGFYQKKISAFCLTFLDFPWPHNLPLKWIKVCFSEPLFIGKMYFECISKNTIKCWYDIGYKSPFFSKYKPTFNTDSIELAVPLMATDMHMRENDVTLWIPKTSYKEFRI